MSTDNSGIRGSGKVTWQALAGIMMTVIMTIATAVDLYSHISTNTTNNIDYSIQTSEGASAPISGHSVTTNTEGFGFIASYTYDLTDPYFYFDITSALTYG